MTLPESYFEELYRRSDDPWGFVDRPYEARKRSLTLAALPNAHYLRVFEPGCSVGVLTAALAQRSAAVVAMDISAAALRIAAARLDPSLGGRVELRHGALPGDWPDGEFDLVVLSEVGYYLELPDLRRMAKRAMSTNGDIIAVHWRHPVDDYPLSGDEVHRALNQEALERGLTSIVTHLEADLALDVWSRDSRSPAARSGLLG